MKRGRPTKSTIRQNIIEILFFIGKAYGYKIHKIYKQIFPTCTREVVYYHLKKGITLGEFEIESIKQEKGDYSWGLVVEKKYYKLGTKAKPMGNERVQKFIEEHPEYRDYPNENLDSKENEKSKNTELVVNANSEPAVIPKTEKHLTKIE